MVARAASGTSVELGGAGHHTVFVDVASTAIAASRHHAVSALEAAVAPSRWRRTAFAGGAPVRGHAAHDRVACRGDAAPVRPPAFDGKPVERLDAGNHDLAPTPRPVRDEPRVDEVPERGGHRLPAAAHE